MNITKYAFPCPEKLRVAVVSDLHEDDPEEVLRALAEIQPDLILCPGDTLERQIEGRDPRDHREFPRMHRILRKAALIFDSLLPGGKEKGNRENGYRFLREAAAMAPVICSMGNHEWVLTEEDQTLFRELGIRVLDNADMVFGGLRIGGLSSATDREWLKRFSEKDGYKLLLCHHPEYYPKFLKGLNFDLIVSGHAHGGQLGIFGRGLFSTAQGFFPKFCRGVYEGNLVVSAGCANTASFPRWGNPTEVVVLELG